MLGPTHTIMGLSAGAITLTTITGQPLTQYAITHPATTSICVIIAAGAATIPDFDTNNKQMQAISGFGKIISHILVLVSQQVWALTKTRYDQNPKYGFHRYLTHTLIFATLITLLFTATTTTRTGIGIWLGISIFTLFTSGILNQISKEIPKGTILGAATLALIIFSSIATTQTLHDTPLSSLLTASFIAGIASHFIGDIITKDGIPLFAIILKINGQRWHRISLLPIESSSKLANSIVATICTTLAALALIADPQQIYNNITTITT